ncbi:MAG TPA: HAMP domain-containing sensor histidine kinase [Streptosporangiaceae bacterium]|jgi:signal transduction histidine kinase|nr:HAMP domain-containing sensor histidine kinase [Streptosporangiaceae bacterium]
MARRIAATVLALITALLAIVAVPLGLLTAAQDRTDFADETADAARTLANVAEERLGDGTQGPALARTIRSLNGRGDRVTVYDAAGRVVAGSPGRPVAARHVTRHPHASALSPARSFATGDRLVVLVPVIPDSGTGSLGTVALSRSTASYDHRVTVLWTLIAAVSAAGLLAGVGIAIGLARWASRPITSLAEAARRLGGGALDTRAEVSSGPPEVRRLSATFNTMASRLESLVHGHRALMADVSHQVRTPLAALRLRLDLLAQDSDEATAAELAGAQEEIARLARLVNGLLAVARAENVTAAPAPVSADEVVRDRAAAWRPAAEERGVTLTTVTPAPVCALACEGHLEQILDNLIANALDALEAGGTVRVGATEADGRASIRVADNGRGMTGAQQRAAFRRFASGTPGGTGLGLTIVNRLVLANAGSAAMSDTPGGGLTVTINLPLTGPQRGFRRSSALSSGNPGDLNRF